MKTPKEAFNLLKEIFPWLHKIVYDKEFVVIYDSNHEKSFCFHQKYLMPINWGNTTEYHQKWTAITIADIVNSIVYKIDIVFKAVYHTPITSDNSKIVGFNNDMGNVIIQYEDEYKQFYYENVLVLRN
jgi:hypothetical protein